MPICSVLTEIICLTFGKIVDMIIWKIENYHYCGEGGEAEMNRIFRVLMAIVALAGIAVSVLMIQHGIQLELPEKFIYISKETSAYEEPWGRNVGVQYVGENGYNYVVEASLKAGYYNAVSQEKTIYRVGGTGLLLFSAFGFFYSLNAIRGEGDHRQGAGRPAEDGTQVEARGQAGLLRRILSRGMENQGEDPEKDEEDNQG